ncbi:MAG: metal-dependent transcriptional regulator [Pseudonocardiales bacterium]|nr:metal-dependent transcriptional regulator [Pseudonocardiales bacterium]
MDCGCVDGSVSESVERYLKAIFDLATRVGQAPPTALAGQVGVSTASASAMAKRLEAAGLVRREGSSGLHLTPHGERHAVSVVRRHRLLETFLVRVLDVPWEEVHVEAEGLEHAVSDRLLRRIDEFLGHPARDPHGDPIPPASGQHEESWPGALTAAEVGRPFRVIRVEDRDPAALRYLGELGLVPGAAVVLEERAPFGGPLWVRVDGGGRHAIGPALAERVHGESQ